MCEHKDEYYLSCDDCNGTLLEWYDEMPISKMFSWNEFIEKLKTQDNIKS